MVKNTIVSKIFMVTALMVTKYITFKETKTTQNTPKKYPKISKGTNKANDLIRLLQAR